MEIIYSMLIIELIILSLLLIITTRINSNIINSNIYLKLLMLVIILLIVVFTIEANHIFFSPVHQEKSIWIFYFLQLYFGKKSLKNIMQERVNIASLRLLAIFRRAPGWHLGTWFLECSLHSLMDKDDSPCLDCVNTVIYGE